MFCYERDRLFVKILLIAVCSISTLGNVTAQEGSTSDPRRSLGPEGQTGASASNLPYFSPREPVNCEIAGVYIDDALARIQDTGGYLIVIARLGDGEQSQELNRRRLEELREYTSQLRQYSQIGVVVAHGERVRAYGRLELYAGGKLLYVLPMPRRANLDLFSCNRV